ncbi:MAG: pyridoxamine 5'-phosphate oxidase family protein [Corynebacterium sp.]|uniref:pyridoxamine 5'-phosphate oxidase family protein n=1 Tax=Corynebacterium sp. TaxID=1720 RepID=UPI0026DFBEC7|nr:pyridoxamine 5'-phosphate oxidase family protein [Corynebacterium sp.]MDO5668704.1 pyridoxamine 5'-phosphate oxidase family protein [Corynebacterium sp.]
MSTVTREDIVKEMRNERFVMLTSKSDTGKLHSHPMTPLEVTDTADAYFFIKLDTGHADNLRHDPQVNLAFTDNSTWLSVAGTVDFLEGEEKNRKVEEHWSEATEAFYTGKNDPQLGVIRVTTDTAQLWNQQGGMIGALVEFAKMKVTGEKPTGGSDTLNL